MMPFHCIQIENTTNRSSTESALMTSINVHRPSLIPAVVQVTLSSETIPITLPVVNVFRLSIAPELEIEFELFLDTLKIGTSCHGILQCTVEEGQLTAFGKTLSNSDPGAIQRSYIKELVTGGVVDPGIRLPEKGLSIRFFSAKYPDYVYITGWTIPLLVETYNIWIDEVCGPFELTGCFRFANL